MYNVMHQFFLIIFKFSSVFCTFDPDSFRPENCAWQHKVANGYTIIRWFVRSVWSADRLHTRFYRFTWWTHTHTQTKPQSALCTFQFESSDQLDDEWLLILRSAFVSSRRKVFVKIESILHVLHLLHNSILFNYLLIYCLQRNIYSSSRNGHSSVVNGVLSMFKRLLFWRIAILVFLFHFNKWSSFFFIFHFE